MKKQILAIDDSKAIRFLLQTVFARKFNVVTASDGCSAMHWLTKRNLPDLIIAEPKLPDMQNWELIEYLSSSRIYGAIPLIVLSDLDVQETQAKCLENGVDIFFQKPFNPVELVEAVENMSSLKQSPLLRKVKVV